MTRDELTAYLTDYPRQMGLGTDDPAAVLDRYHAPAIEWWNDGLRLDRDRLLAHARPARRNTLDVVVEVHDALVDGDRVAARSTMTATTRQAGEVRVELYLFGRLDPDGRLRRIDQVTRATT